MYAGHFAAALAIKAKEPRAPGWALLLGVGLLDVLFGIFVMLGIEKVTMTPHVGHGFTLDFIGWSHSLSMSLVWAVLFSAPFWRRGSAVAFAVAFAVFSHFLLDVPMHPPDMALWPHSTVHLGLGLWNRLPTGWWWVELAVIAVFCAYYVARARALKTFGGRALWACAVILALTSSTRRGCRRGSSSARAREIVLTAGDAVHLGQLVFGETPARGLRVCEDLLGLRCAGDHRCNDPVSEQPGECEVEQRVSARVGEGGELLRDSAVAIVQEAVPGPTRV